MFFVQSWQPFRFVKILSQTNSPFWSLIFFSINFCLALLVWALENIFESPQGKVFMQIFSEMLFFFPFALVGFIVFAFILYFLSVVLGGKSSFAQTLSIMGLSSYPLILLFVPILTPLSLIWWCFVLVFGFQKIHQYKFLYAIISVVVPFLLIAAIMLAVGFLKLPIDQNYLVPF